MENVKSHAKEFQVIYSYFTLKEMEENPHFLSMAVDNGFLPKNAIWKGGGN